MAEEMDPEGERATRIIRGAVIYDQYVRVSEARSQLC